MRKDNMDNNFLFYLNKYKYYIILTCILCMFFGYVLAEYIIISEKFPWYFLSLLFCVGGFCISCVLLYCFLIFKKPKS